jgi:hypothetical protein
LRPLSGVNYFRLRKFQLSPARPRRARKLGKLDNAAQEPWRLPRPAFIESLYRKGFGKRRPEAVHSIEERARHLEQNKAARREANRWRRSFKMTSVRTHPIS